MNPTPSTGQRTLIAALLVVSAVALTAVFGGETTSLSEEFLSADATQASDATLVTPVMSRGGIESIAAAFER